MKLALLISLFLIQGAAGNREVDRAIRALKPCRFELPSEALTGWRSVELAQLVHMSIPMSSLRQSDSSTFCLHGCDQWINGGLSIAVSYGLWAPSSFAGESWGTACLVERASVSVVVMQRPDEKAFVAWPRPHKRNAGNDAVVNLKWSTEEERVEALRIIGSIRR